jgi:hypothetical protein
MIGWAMLQSRSKPHQEQTMQLGETIATYDIALALRGENGKFEVTSPAGEIYRVTCQPNHSISSLEWSGDRSESRPFMIRKVAEPVTKEAGNNPASQTIENLTQARAGHAPFLLENQGKDIKSSSGSDTVSTQVKTAESEPAGSTILSFDLRYVENDPEAKQPSACICVTPKLNSGTGAGPLLTTQCLSFNELDVEIRRLHAQLDDLRYRARKKFYENHALAAGA